MLESFLLSSPNGVERKMVIPKRVDRSTMVAMFMPSSRYQLAVSLFVTHGSEYATSAIFDSGSGPSFIRRELLPNGMENQPIGELELTQFYELK